VTVGRRGPTNNGNDLHDAVADVDIEQDSPVTHAAAKRRRLAFEARDVAGERILPHVIESMQQALPVRTRRASDAFFCDLAYPQLPERHGGHRRPRSRRAEALPARL